jgi:hypothetical protein
MLPASGRSSFRIINGKAFFFWLGYWPEYNASMSAPCGVDATVEIANLPLFLQEWERHIAKPAQSGYFYYPLSEKAKQLGLDSEADVHKAGLDFDYSTLDHELWVVVFTPYDRTKNKEASYYAHFPLGTPLGVIWGKVLAMVDEHVEFMMGRAPFKQGKSRKSVHLRFSKEDLKA